MQLATKSAFSQENEFGGWAGTAVYLGDLNPTFSFKNARWATGLFYRYNFNNRMVVRAQVNYAFLDAADSRIKRYPYLQARNLSFRSQIFEVAATYEIIFFNKIKRYKNLDAVCFYGRKYFLL